MSGAPENWVCSPILTRGYLRKSQMTIIDPPTATEETSQVAQNPETQSLQQQVSDLAKQVSAIMALLTSRATNAPIPPTPRHLDIQN